MVASSGRPRNDVRDRPLERQNDRASGRIKRATLYSSTGRRRPPLSAGSVPAPEPAPPTEGAAEPPQSKPSRWRRFVGRFASPLLFIAGGLLVVGSLAGYQAWKPAPRVYTQED